MPITATIVETAIAVLIKLQISRIRSKKNIVSLE